MIQNDRVHCTSDVFYEKHCVMQYNGVTDGLSVATCVYIERGKCVNKMLLSDWKSGNEMKGVCMLIVILSLYIYK